ncbi:MAG: alanine--tRNA ligase [Puniceicoccales bacterium]|jgi:alanyl-tRNA synthetase|nr:alanine--tRNA ligase [Puniceicoccales bacterium]
MNSDEIRRSFLDFFSGRGHGIVKSSSLMPDAPNLLFTNAGMNQFVPIFLGEKNITFPRAADSQKCIRAGGKHNDLDDVGFDTYHHTFFEMLGNWSFGDYFKREAIEMAWELLTKVWHFPTERLYATVYSPGPGDPASFDGEAHATWEKIFSDENIDPKVHIVSGAKADNFWMMGDTGPCGPCTEIHMDLTPDGSGGNLVNGGTPRCIELWNLVFIQFNATADGKFTALENKHVDTGMGLERVAGIFATTGKFSDFSRLPSNYDSDLFSDIFCAIERMGKKKYSGTVPPSRSAMSERERVDFWFRAIADHARTLTFAVSDGIFPSNEGRGYVLRRILRRAVMFGKLMQLPNGFFAELSATVAEKMCGVFPELEEQKSSVEAVLRSEEMAFARTLDNGVLIFDDICKKSRSGIRGDDAFLLYDTYGFPLDLTQLMAADRGIPVDVDGFEANMERQRSMARAAQKKSTVEISDRSLPPTEFVGYSIDAIENVTAQLINVAEDGDSLLLIFDRTPFYAECGGQVADRGTAHIGGVTFHITDVQKDKNGCHVHRAKKTTATAKIGQSALLTVNKNIRRNTARNHSATHILQFALRKVLGNHVKQAGSYVDDKRLRFDFNALSAPTDSEIERIENLVREKILNCEESSICEVPMGAIPDGCLANFGEKYGEIVRVVALGDFSKELCGGCHVKNTAEIACFRIVSSSAIASGIRRMEALTGEAAFDLFRSNCAIVDKQCRDFSCQPCDVVGRVEQLLVRCRELEKFARAARQTELKSIAADIAASGMRSEDGLVHVEKNVQSLDGEDLRTLALNVLNAIGEGTVILSARLGEKITVAVCCSKAAISFGHHAGNIVKKIAAAHGGSGGGRPEFAMGGYCA